MMSIRSLADFNGSPLGGAVTGWHRHRHRPGLTIPADTTNEGWGLLHGHQRGPRPGHTRGLSHGHGHPSEVRSQAMCGEPNWEPTAGRTRPRQAAMIADDATSG